MGRDHCNTSQCSRADLVCEPFRVAWLWRLRTNTMLGPSSDANGPRITGEVSVWRKIGARSKIRDTRTRRD